MPKELLKLSEKDRIIGISCTLFGAASASFHFIVSPYLNRWNPSGCTLGCIAGSIAALNIFGLIHLFKKRDACGRWLTVAGLVGNGLSLLVLLCVTAAYIFFQYIFRM